MDGDAERLPLPDQHEQPLAPCDPRVNQVALQKHVVLGRHRNHHCREFRALRLVNRDGVGQCNFIQLPEVVLHEPIIEADRNLVFN